MKNKFVLSILLVAFLTNFACGVASQARSPVPGKGLASGQTQSGVNGEARFDDPINGNILTVTLQDEDTAQPVANIEVSFASKGKTVLIIVQDPSGTYAPAVQEVRYAELLRNEGPSKLAAPDQQLSLAAVILLVKFVSLYESATKWIAFLQNFPRIEDWGTEQASLCVTPEQGREALGLGADSVIGFIAKGIPATQQIEEAINLLFEELVSQGTGDILDAYHGSQTPSEIRFTLFSIKEGFPKFLRIDGFCLEPLDESSAQSALTWLLHGIEQKDMYPFETLTNRVDFGYANYLEGGDPVGYQRFFRDLEERLKSSNVSCMGYYGDQNSIQVWTTGWSPAWEMHQLCYVGCEALDPPYQSRTAGFFLSPLEGKWRLVVNYVNEPENYYFGGQRLIACNHPEKLDVR
jgi:hypothetical protein